MRIDLKPALAAVLSAAAICAAVPTEAFAGPVTVASPSSLGLTASAEKVYFRRYYGGYYPRRYYRGYYYNPGAAVAALGLLGAGVAAASGPYYAYPAYGYPPPPPYGGYYYGW